MNRTLLLGLILAISAPVAGADIVHHRVAERIVDGTAPPGAGSLAGTCTIRYFNVCSGWIWLWSGWDRDDQVGVIYDLPEDCGKQPGEQCTNTGFWWYWRYTQPGHGFPVSYSLYEIDAQGCLVEPPIGTSGLLDPVERWNYVPGLGTTSADRVAVVANWYGGVLPYAASDNNDKNENAAGCGGLIGSGTSVQFVAAGATVYCPPVPLQDVSGYVDLMVQAKFSCATTATENTSWGEIKQLFE